MDKKYLWIGGGALVLLIMLAASRNSAAQSAAATAAAPVPDTSQQDTANIQGKYGLLTTLANAAGTLDIVNAQGAASAAHDAASIAGINANYAGQIGVTNANYQGQGYVASIQGAIASALASIQAKNNVDLATIDQSKAIGLAQIDQGTQLGLKNYDYLLGLDTNKTAVAITSLNDTVANQKNSFDYNAHLSDNATAQTINEKTQEQQTKRSVWGDVTGAVTGVAGVIAAIF